MMESIPNGWELIPLGSLFDFKNGVNAGKSDYGSGIKFINVSEVIYNSSIRYDDIPGMVSLDEKSIEKNSVIRGDVLFNRTSETQDEIGLTAVYLDDEPVVFGGFVIRGRPLNGRLADDFKKYAFESSFVRREIIKRGQGAVRVNIGQGDLSQVLMPVPPRPEQEKIAEILGTWDEALAQTERLIALEEQRKKGLMQRLLMGQVRFPEFEGRPWQEIKFRDLFDLQIGRTPSRKEERYWDSQKVTNNIWLSISDLNSKYVSDSSEYISDKGRDESGIVQLPEGTVVMSFKLTIGRPAILRKPIYTNEAICGLLPKDTKQIDTEYLYYALHVVNFDREIDQAVKGKTLNLSKIRRLELQLPLIEEQRKIAAVLQTCDEKLTLLQQKLAALQQQKKGLMQRLLTGQLRV